MEVGLKYAYLTYTLKTCGSTGNFYEPSKNCEKKEGFRLVVK